jgi:uncharacterized protein (TIGR00369 family)
MWESFVDKELQGWITRTAVGFNELAGPFLARRDGENWLSGFRVEARHLNFNGAVHGGMMATFADSFLGQLVASAIKPRRCVTLQLNVQYVRAAALGDFVIGRGEIIRVTHSIAFVVGQLTVNSNIVAIAQGVWKLLESPSHGDKPDARRDTQN